MESMFKFDITKFSIDNVYKYTTMIYAAHKHNTTINTISFDTNITVEKINPRKGLTIEWLEETHYDNSVPYFNGKYKYYI